ncbi:MAG: adenosylcobalamin-dependent ribonucleoside-diphosphate reductase [Patescibacteria group bacterium]
MRLNKKYFLNPAHLEIAKARYFLKDKDGKLIENDIDDVFERETKHIFQNDTEENRQKALKYRREKKIVPAGRMLAQAGTDVKNLCNCFLIGFDDDTREAISELKRKHFHIQAHGGGTGLNFSTLRPHGSVCKTNQSRSSGAVGFIGDFSYQSSNIEQGGNRSGANLGLLEDWHPDLLEFITKKSNSNWENIKKFATINDKKEFESFQWNNPHQWQMFNVSVLLSNDFMNRVVDNDETPWILKWDGSEWHLWEFDLCGKTIKVTAPDKNMAFYKASCTIPYFNNQNLKLVKGPYDVSASEWFDIICRNAWDDGCPGIMFIDVARKFHNGEYFNSICGANPCGEILLPKNSVCCLCSICLPSFFKNGKFDWEDFKEAIRIAIRGLDNIIDITKIGEEDIDANTVRERRIGLGTTGIAELLILEKKKYSSEEGREYTAKILEVLRDTSYEASIELAKERGPFPAFDFEGFSKSEFFKTLPEEIQNNIKIHGIRNVNLNTQQPTGTTGTMLGFSQGCEPYYSMCFTRNSRVGSFFDGSPAFSRWLKKNKIDYSKYKLSLQELKKDTSVPEYFEESHEISWMDHIKMQAVFAKYIDQGISKTINLPNSATVEDVKNAYTETYKLGIKSVTVYRDGCKQQILENGSKIEDKRPERIMMASSPKRPTELPCDIHNTVVRGEKWTVLVGLLDGKPYEVFAAPQESFELSSKYKKGTIVKNGDGAYHLDMCDFKIKNISKYIQSDEHRIITRLISTCLRHGVPMSFITDQLTKVDGTVVDFSKAILRVLYKYIEDETIVTENKEKVCSNCGSTNIKFSNGCYECLDCNYSKCG